ncbi:MAG: hypothetical protein Q9171_001712 [Xanthocarpia ochracea]
MTINHSDDAIVRPLEAKLTRSNSHRKCNDTISITGSNAKSIDISFQRTIRVPDDQGKNELPPSLGTFPLYSVRNFQDTLPTNMAVKGGLFFPMYQREAMWINFKSSNLFAIKIFLGGINAVSGEPIKDDHATVLRRLTKLAKNDSIQDYVVTPNQLWLDGIATEHGYVRQFVAMPLGLGYSVEAQVTGRDVVGGLQFVVVPAIPPPMPFKASFEGRHRPGTISIVVKMLTGKTLEIHNIAPGNTVRQIKDHIKDLEGIPADQQRHIHDGKQLEEFIRLRGGGGPSIADYELGIAPGGLIKQCVLEDTHPAWIWDTDRKIAFNVQILNSELFQQVTGVAPPDTPISAKTYSSHGLPFFDIYNETSKVEGDFRSVKSVVAMDKEKWTNKHEEPHVENPVILLNPNGTTLDFKPVSVLKEELKRLQHAQF